MTRTFWRGMLGAVAALAILAPATAQAQITRVSGADTRQSFGINIGAFMPKGADSRVEGDALFVNGDALLFDIKDFTGASIGAEWLVGVSKYIEAGVDVSIYQRTVPSIYRNVVNFDDSEIEQDLKLRIIPVTASVRFLPLGRDAAVQPYIGVGASLLNWRYTETGEFVDFTDDSVFRANIVAKGSTVQPVIIGGVRFPVADVWTIGGEFRYQRGEGDTGGAGAGFATGADKIDLGGWTANFSVHIRF